jgi:hypothetical protein|tara:strand:- start:480 stop:863 length:384 start_codon:yes stop_codon:yes gene_type:complete
MSETKQPDWDKITEGKIRHGFAVAAFTNGIDMTEEVCTNIECWVRYVVDGKYVTNNKIVTNGANEVEEKTDAEYIAEIIGKRLRDRTLTASERLKVEKSLDDGHITKENLDVCLRRIEELAKNNESI